MLDAKTISNPPLIPLILCGGAGSRLWPLSRSARPKQFLDFKDGQSLLGATLQRAAAASSGADPILVANAAHAHLLREDMKRAGTKGTLILEPLRRDSCAAIVAGALAALARHQDALILVLAADHHVPDDQAFAAAVARARSAAEAGFLVTFGIKPDHPATGYGYIRMGEAMPQLGIHRLAKFVEKPDAAMAQRFVEEGLLWNSGNFLFRVETFLAEAEQLVPDVVSPVRHAFEMAERQGDAVFLEPINFAAAKAISVDFAVMEKVAEAAVCPVDYAWNDIGSWAAVSSLVEKDEQGNAVLGQVHLHQARGNLVYAEGLTTAVLGVDDLVVVATRDAVLVARLDQSQAVKTIVDNMKAQGLATAEHSPVSLQAWGSSELLHSEKETSVKRHVVMPGLAFPLHGLGPEAASLLVVSGEAAHAREGVGRTWAAGQFIPLTGEVMPEIYATEAAPLVLLELARSAAV